MISKLMLRIGAELESSHLYIDGEYVGDTPMSIPIIPEGFDAFMLACFKGNEVHCDKETLHPYLADKSVSRYWAYLTKSQRISLGKFIIDNFALFHADQYATGKLECKGDSGNWNAATCLPNAIMRMCKMNYKGNPYPHLSGCYYRINSEVHCYVDITGVEQYHLPCYLTFIYREAPRFSHMVCALQVGEEESKFDNWLFFQWGESDIKPCTGQMPCGSDVAVWDVLPRFIDCNWVEWGIELGQWHIDEKGNVI